MLSFSLSDIQPGESTLHCENIGTVFELLVQTHSCSGLLRFLNSESAGAKIKELAEFG